MVNEKRTTGGMTKLLKQLNPLLDCWDVIDPFN